MSKLRGTDHRIGFFSPCAKADQYDFVNDLDSHGVYSNNIESVINEGKATCAALRREISLDTILDGLETKGSFSPEDAALVVVAASDDMCPDTIPFINAFINPPPAANSNQVA